MHALCPLNEIDQGTGREFRLQTSDGIQYLALFRQGDRLFACRNACPHQGRNLNWGPDEFLFDPQGRLVCPHHGATFELSDGTCVEGPCKGARLVQVPVEVRDGVVYLAGELGD